MAIDGWAGATRVVEGVGECPETRYIVGDEEYDSHDYVVRIGRRMISTWEYDSWARIYTRWAYSRQTGFLRGDRCIRIHPDDLAALNALADAQPDGTWRAGGTKEERA